MKSFIFRFLAASLPNGLPLPILRGPARGYFWLVGAAPGPAKGLSVLWNRSEPTQLQEGLRLAQSAQCCFDIGAHTGLYSMVFAKNCPKVFAFEPFPRNLAWLERTLNWNRVKNVTVLPWAISSQTGPTLFNVGSHSSLGRLGTDGALPVFSISLKDFLQRYSMHPDVMKIDVEGEELELLKGGSEFLRNRKPALLLSVHSSELRQSCLGLLKGFGYSRFKPLDTSDPNQANEFCIEA